jgi:iron complex outermembrane receptor protein
MPYTFSGDLIGWSYYNYSGQEQVASAFAEADAPILERLDLDVALRMDKVGGYDPAVSPKAGFRWRPWDRMAIRGTYSVGFRAPNPVEKGAGNQNSGTLDMTGNGFLGVFRTLSNPNLQPERSHMFTVGPVFEPARDATLEVSFWWLRRTNEINLVDPFAILSGAPGWPGAVIVRDSRGDVVELSAPFENNSASNLRGIDFTARDRLLVAGLGTLSAALSWSYLASYSKTFAGTTTYEYAGTHGPMIISGNTGTPKNRANLLLSWERGPAALSAYVNYVDSFLNVDHLGEPCASSLANGNPAPPGCRIGSFTTVDLHASYRPARRVKLYFTATNLFDRIAPLDPSAYINFNFDPALHLDGAVGRTFTLGVRYDS